MRRRERVRSFGRNGAAIVELLDGLRQLRPADYRRLETCSEPIGRLLFGRQALAVLDAAQRRRNAHVLAARAAAWETAVTIDLDPELRGSRLASELAGVLVVADSLDPAAVSGVRAVLLERLGDDLDRCFQALRLPARTTAA